ncbi:adenosylhomocysteine nucleosidase [Breznakia sp. PF5-3]|uniref:5'-methylthioadenosine/adenosylhomocysteine nucleosidase n=1 Tax=unclassified Breznakia TaxID=2623764 RepID=UPI002404CB2A|nr:MULTISPECIES: 5'-methylthioadenosine/adenosylhomocysteine nucleosidase [unclassified Breznakia]MDF9824081.1 adenosylhomocysteine nucleosidase [Breznakia sp. PM6-1]MDF9834853.1 adenosylhomocysteine nucleosidase [Breznakia sp. PF5-3]MDF9837125.1 adenosylhomocysteine nucleosidase [Breznakia sp. PFB2-8]MDF9859050.1 adenosylhomocysteine nucleosidase [Breznakia sp. PH5-24]
MIAIIGAMEIEVNALKSKLTSCEDSVVSNIKITKGKMGEQEVVLALSGVGKVNASMTTTLLLSTFDIEYVINIGTAGGLKETQEVLDLVIAKEIIQHDYDTSGLDGDEGYGIISYSDETLIEKALAVLAEETHTIWVGAIASGDSFVHKMSQVNTIKDHFPEVIACEMEAGAIAFVCNHFKIPCIILRSLSDNAYHTNSEMDFMEYAIQASERSAMFCESFIKYDVK